MALQRIDDGRSFVRVAHRDAHQVGATSNAFWQRVPAREALTEHLVGFRIVGDSARLWTGEDQVGVVLVRDVIGESLKDADHVLERVPARRLQHNGGIDGWCGPGPEEVDAVCDAALGPVAAREGVRRFSSIPSEDPDVLEQLHGRGFVDRLVLRGKGVDRWRDDVQVLLRYPARRELLARKDIAVDTFDVWAHELPAAFGMLVRSIDSDVTAPNDAGAQSLDGRGQTGCLWVMEHHDVVGANLSEQVGDVALRASLRSRGVRSWRAGPRRPVCRRGDCARAS